MLAETVYPVPALRPFSDLDLLVRPADRLRMDALLRDLDCVRVADEHSWDFDIAWDGATLYEAPAGVRVDLHWALLTEPRFAWNEDAQHAVWERAAPLTVAGEPALGLAPRGPRAAPRHAPGRASLAGRPAALLGPRAAPRPRGRHARLGRARRAGAARWRVRHALFFVLLGVRAGFGASVPSAVLAALRPRGPRAALLAALCGPWTPAALERLEYLVTLLLVDRGRDVRASRSGGRCGRRPTGCGRATASRPARGPRSI